MTDNQQRIFEILGRMPTPARDDWAQERRPRYQEPSREQTPAGVIGDTGAEAMPDTEFPQMRESLPAKDVQVTGNNEWDYQVERVPVYVLPSGEQYIGPLEYAPSLPQDMQPSHYIEVPLTPWRTS